MEFILISPTSTKKMDISWIEVETLEGSFVIQSGHAPMILIPAPNKELTIKLKDGVTTVMTVAGGILEINRNKALLLLTHE